MVRQRGYGRMVRQRGYGGARLVRQRGYGNRIIYPLQRGDGIGSIFRSFFRLAKPLIKSGLKIAKPLVKKGARIAKPYVKKAGKYAAREAMKSGREAISDIIEGKNVKQTLKNRGKQYANRGVNTLMKEFQQLGKNL